LLIGCKTHITTKYVLKTNKGNFYLDYVKYANDSVYVVEFNREGKIRRNGVFKESETVLIEK